MAHQPFNHKESTWTLAVGVGGIVILMSVLATLMVRHTTFMERHQDKLLVIKEKTEMALIMREAIRKRSFSLALAQTMEDVFDRDDERMRFIGYARDFVVARERLTALGISPQEQAILNDFQRNVQEGRGIVDNAMDAIVSDGIHGPDVTAILLKAIASQTNQFNDLNRFVAYQKEEEQRQIANTQEQSKKERHTLILLGSMIFLACVIIAILVVRREQWHRNALLSEIEDRIQAQRHTRELNATLEERVEARTRALSDEIATRRAAENKAERANRAKSQFLSSMSHELRTPLNAIIGFSQLLEMESGPDLDDKQRDYIRHIMSSGEHLLLLIKDVLELNKIEEGHASLHFEAVSLRQIIDDCLTLIQVRALEMNVTLIDETKDTPLPTLWSDATRVKQILLNLISNAVKYNKPGGTLTVSFATTGNDNFRLSVRDTGHGIPDDRQANLFVPFDRLGRESGTIEGTGVGLSISKRLAELLGGGVGFTSREGEGSTFWLSLPKTASQNLPESDVLPPANKDATKAETWKPPLKQKVILYVEDNESNMRLMRAVLCMFPGIEMRHASTAEDGIDMAQASPPDLILMDINLPGMSGFEALKVLKGTPETQNIPVIAISADALPKDIEFAAEVGFEMMIAKPIDVGKVQKEVLRILNRLEGGLSQV